MPTCLRRDLASTEGQKESILVRTATEAAGRCDRPRHQLLVIDDAPPTQCSVRAALGDDSRYGCERVAWDEALAAIARVTAQAVVAVAAPPKPQITALCGWSPASPSDPVLVVVPSDASEPLLSLAATISEDLIMSPIRSCELHWRLDRLLAPRDPGLEAARQRLLEDFGMMQLLGSDPVFRNAVKQLPRFARSDMPILITGETGTGKEFCARAVHHLSRRRNSPFVAVDCGALPEQLFENEVFGHARGAFTDAHREHRGLVAMAEGGTLFLDEIDSLSTAAQAKLLRFLQERTFRPLGADRFLQADVNVIAASNRGLERCVDDKQFRSDLYFRLNVLRLDAAPARATPRHRVARRPLPDPRPQRARIGAAILHRGGAAGARALRLARQRARAFQCRAACARALRWRPDLSSAPLHTPAGAAAEGPALHFRAARADAVAAFEQRYVEQLLRRHGGNITRAAEEARKDRRAPR